jgi:hypothetical protein
VVHYSFSQVIGREQREQNQKKQEETEREIHTREKKAFIHKLRYRRRQRGRYTPGRRGHSSTGQVEEETEKAFIHKLR